MGQGNTKEREKYPEWGNSKFLLPISQLSHNSHRHLKAGWGKILMPTAWLPMDNWVKQIHRGPGKWEKDVKMEIDLKQGGRGCSAFLYLSWPEHQERCFHKKWKIQSLVNEPYAWIWASVEMCLYHIKTLDKSLFITQHGKAGLILKVILWFGGMFLHQHFISPAYKVPD